MSSIPRIVISAPSSGHGKTAVSVGVLAALAARGLRPSGFKIGPDFVDAAYLGLASGRPGRNLDPRLVGSHRIAPLFAHGAMGSDVAIVEGTMGLYDGLTSRTDSESTAQIAGLLRAPVVLVVDVAAMGQSAAALVHGFRTYDELLWLGGVVLTRTISSRHEHLLRESLADIGVPVLGALRRRELAALGAGGAALPPREHGLAPAAHRNLDALRGIRRLGELIATAVDLERMLMLARSAPRLATDAWSPTDALALDGVVEPTGDVFAPYGTGHRPVIAVASAYGYAETPELLAAAGAEVVHIDPLRDDRLPDRIDALVVPGGLPEAYTDQLSANTRLRGDVLNLARTGRPIIAEGAGMVWLGREIDGLPMCGVLDTTATTTDRYVVGYREAAACMASVVHGRGDSVTGHKLHRTSITPRAGSRPAWVWAGGHPEGFIEGAVHASYLSVHWAGVPRMASRLVSAAAALSSAYSPPHPITSAPPSMAQSWALPTAGTYKSPTASVTPALPPPYVTDGDDLPPLEPWAPEIPPRVDQTAAASASAAVSPGVTESTPPVGMPVVSPAASAPSGGAPASAPASPAPLTAGSVPTHDPEPLPVDTGGWPRLPTMLGDSKPDAAAAPSGEPVSAAPMSSTPVSATPVSASPVVAPASSVPASSAPVSATPVSATPVSATPVSASPVVAPASSVPASSVPASSAPVSSAPVSAPAAEQAEVAQQAERAGAAERAEWAGAAERAEALDVAETGRSDDSRTGNRPSGAEAV